MGRHLRDQALEIEIDSNGKKSQKAYPSKLFVEVTTKCNFRCPMCPKQSSEKPLDEGDFSPVFFGRLTDAFENLHALILTGIGEPLLHPGLEEMIVLGKRYMPATGWVGFQTNGSLLDIPRARSLVEAGTDKICISIDSLSPGRFRRTRSCGELDMVERALGAVNLAKSDLDARHVKVGIEFVLMKRNFKELPHVISWAAERGVSVLIATHMLPYHEVLQEEALYPPNTDASINLFRASREKASEHGIDLRDYFHVKAKTSKTAEDNHVIGLMGEIISKAHLNEIFLHIENLIAEDESRLEEVSEVFAEAKDVAASGGLELLLPAPRPLMNRWCDFVENGSAFVAWKGTVHPCYFLWHRYSCFQHGNRKDVAPKSFGKISEQGILKIWNSKAFVSFREAVLKYDYPHCGNCNITPCDLTSEETFEQDCYGCDVPCGDCPWCLGLLQCLN